MNLSGVQNQYTNKLIYNPSNDFTHLSRPLSENNDNNLLLLKELIHRYSIELLFYQVKYNLDENDIQEVSESIQKYYNENKTVNQKFQIQTFLNALKQIDFIYPLLKSYDKRLSEQNEQKWQKQISGLSSQLKNLKQKIYDLSLENEQLHQKIHDIFEQGIYSEEFQDFLPNIEMENMKKFLRVQGEEIEDLKSKEILKEKECQSLRTKIKEQIAQISILEKENIYSNEKIEKQIQEISTYKINQMNLQNFQNEKMKEIEQLQKYILELENSLSEMKIQEKKSFQKIQEEQAKNLKLQKQTFIDETDEELEIKTDQLYQQQHELNEYRDTIEKLKERIYTKEQQIDEFKKQLLNTQIKLDTIYREQQNKEMKKDFEISLKETNFQIPKNEDYQNLIDSVSREMEAKIKSIEIQYQNFLIEKDEQYFKLKESCKKEEERLREQLDCKEQQIQNLKDDLKNIENKVKIKLDEIMKEKNNLQKQIRSIEQEKLELQMEKESNGIDGLLLKIKNLEEDINFQREQQKQNQQKIDSLQKDKYQDQEKVIKLEVEIEDLKKKIDFINLQKTQIQQQFDDRLLQEKKSMREKIENMKLKMRDREKAFNQQLEQVNKLT